MAFLPRLHELTPFLGLHHPPRAVSNQNLLDCDKDLHGHEANTQCMVLQYDTTTCANHTHPCGYVVLCIQLILFLRGLVTSLWATLT